MIQIKCGSCKMICDIDEDSFSKLREPENRRIRHELRCVSCGKVVPGDVVNHVFETIDKTCFEGWEIGTYFCEE